VIDMIKFLEKQEGWEEECKKVADSLHKFGILIVRDPRVINKDNDTFIDMMEEYFKEVGSDYYEGKVLKDAFPKLSY